MCKGLTSVTSIDSMEKNAIKCNGQAFHNATQFRNALHLMSLVGRFKYTILSL